MLAMLRKDCWVMGRYTASLIIFWTLAAGIYARVSETKAGWLFPIAYTIALNAVGSDQACRWDRFAAMTSLRPWQMVLEKYLLAYGLTALLAALGALAGWAAAMGRGGLNILNMWTAAIMDLLLLATALPLAYRFGRQRGTVVLLCVWGIVAAAILGTAYWRYELIVKAFGWMETVPAPALAAGITAALAAGNVWSILLSIRFYTRRQRGWYN